VKTLKEFGRWLDGSKVGRQLKTTTLDLTKPLWYRKSMYLFLDDEMGGLDREKYSLLSVYLLATDDQFNAIGSLYLYLKPDDGIYRVCAEAMNVNKINLVEHDTRAITYKEGSTKLYNWLKQLTNEGKTKATVVGHGVYADVEWIIYHLMSRGSWETFTSYRKLDTQAVCQFLKACGLFPETVSGSLISIAQYFGITVDENACHDAKYDTELTYKVFMALVKQMTPIIEVKPKTVTEAVWNIVKDIR
jgi:oligoribonuclease (3'-5' exoribonuclease)